MLREFLPEFAKAEDARAYALTIAEMMTRSRDAHCFIHSNQLSKHIGATPPAVRVRIIEGLSVATRIYDKAITGLEIGDIVVAVEGVDAKARLAMLARYRSASTPQGLEAAIVGRLLCGPDGSIAAVTLRGADGNLKQIALPRAEANWELMNQQRDGEIVKVLPSNIGYADLDRLPAADVDEMFERFKNTRAIIFDMRGYPHGTAWAIAPRLTDRSNVAAALFERPTVCPDAVPAGETLSRSTATRFVQRLPLTDKWRYKGRTVMLIDERAVSQAEHTGLFFKAANGTLLVGSPTAGANGDVTQFFVPGNIRIGFSGQAVKHPDGRQLQRIGLIPDVEVRPTIAGLRAGRDEVLEKAIEIIETGAM